MDINYRHQARQHLQSAKNELAAHADQRLKFAALELRMTMECLTYDRALAFQDEFPPKQYETWQPKKVMSVLLEIDPDADKDSSWAMGTEEVPGQPASTMHSLGSEKVLNMSALKKHYDALGSYLHVPSMKQARDQAPLDFGKLRSRCNDLGTLLEQVLASPIFNVTLGNFASIDCVECGKPIRKRLRHGQKEVKAECFECVASYTIIDEGDGKVLWKPHNQEIECANPKCHENVIVWERELDVGREWKCKACGGRNVVSLGIAYVADSQQGS
jgi:hypothetical protein